MTVTYRCGRQTGPRADPVSEWQQQQHMFQTGVELSSSLSLYRAYETLFKQDLGYTSWRALAMSPIKLQLPLQTAQLLYTAPSSARSTCRESLVSVSLGPDQVCYTTTRCAREINPYSSFAFTFALDCRRWEHITDASAYSRKNTCTALGLTHRTAWQAQPRRSRDGCGVSCDHKASVSGNLHAVTPQCGLHTGVL